ncbi:MAG: hypothetical protein WB677_27530 [Xanthobacteraceae bacterium]
MSHNHGGKSKRQGDPEAARKVIAFLEGKPILEPPPAPEWVARRGEVKLHVSNLSYDVAEQDVRELFSRCGEIAECHLFMDSLDGRRMSRGFACVRMRGQEAGAAALAMDGWSWAGRSLKIKLWGRDASGK